MLKLKHIAAYFLLLVYGISYGHQIIPHHHHDIDEAHNHHHSGLHDHCVTEEETHVHVAHENHFDEGFMDYLACILSNHEHNPATECELISGLNDQKNASNNSIKVGNPCINSHVRTGLYIVQSKLEYANPQVNWRDESAYQKGKRGPPVA